MPPTGTRFAARVLQPFTELGRWDLQRGRQTKEHARCHRRQHGEGKRAAVDANASAEEAG